MQLTRGGLSIAIDSICAWLILVLSVAVGAFPFWPGRMNADTLNEIHAAATGIYTSQYSPIIEAIWRPFYRAGFGPGWVLTLQIALFVWGAYVLLRRVFKPIGASVATLLITISPQAYGGLALIGRDTWFLSLLVASFACLSLALDSHGRSRIAWVIGVIGFAWFAQASRQNAVTSIIVPLSLLIGCWLAGRGHTRPLPLVIKAVIGGLFATLAIYGSQIPVNDALHVEQVNPTAPLFLYDLANISRIEGHNEIPKSVDRGESIGWLDTYTSVQSDLALISGPSHPVAWPIVGQAYHALKHAWLLVVEHHPLTYLRERLHQMQWTLGIGTDQIWIYHPFIDNNPFGYKTTFPSADRIANDWMQVFTDPVNNGGILFAPWIYLLICCVPIVLAVRRQSTTRLILGGLGLAVLTYQVGLFLGLEGVNFRYEAPCETIAGIVIAAGVGRLWSEARLGKRTRLSPTTSTPGA